MNKLNITKRRFPLILTRVSADYWYGQVNEKVAAAFLDLQPRTLQAYRQRGGGPLYVAISPRCVRYRRIDLHRWAEDRLRTSTRKVESDS